MANEDLKVTDDGILLVDPYGKIVAFNPPFAEMWKIPPEVLDRRKDDDALGFVLEQLKDPEGFLARVRELYANPSQKSSDEIEFKDGRVFLRTTTPQTVNGKIVARVWRFHQIKGATDKG